MSNYKIATMKPLRVMNYRFSVDSKTDAEYLKLKASVAEHNQVQEDRLAAGLTPHFLIVRGRGRGPTVVGGNKDHVIDARATYFDVYVQRDTDKTARRAHALATTKAQGVITSSFSKLKNILNPVQVSA